VFQNGAVENPAVTGAEIRGDILAYVRTMKLAQLEGASALEHMREDLNDRVATRTDGRVSELILETMIVQ
jgi:flagellar FliL protein